MTETTTEKKKTTTKKTPAPRKVAPDIIVRSSAKRSSIDELYRDNPGKKFLYAPRGTSAASLGSQGLVPVKGANGAPMHVGARVICEDVGTKRIKALAKAQAEAKSRIGEIKDPKVKNSPDAVARAKAPPS